VAAVGILMLIIVAYLVVGSTLSTADIITSTQKDVTLQNEERMRTEISFFTLNVTKTPLPSEITLCLNNTGSETIRGLTYMDIFTKNSTGILHYRYDPDYETTSPVPVTWGIDHIDRDFINWGLVDPGEAVWINATYAGEKPTNILVATGNGVYTSTTI